MLFQVAPHDPATMAVTVVVIVVVTLVAALVPARRASRVDPVDSLR
jgi:ABC-type antimicrobial peptide transport system permease subunit